VEKHMFDVARFVQARQALSVGLDLVMGKNEPILRRVVWNAFVFMEFQESRGALEVALLLVPALGLDLAEVVHGLLELAGESRVMQAQGGESAVGVDDVERHFLSRQAGLIGGRVYSAVEKGGFERGDAVDAPGGVGEFLGQLGLGGSGGLVFVEEAAAVELVGGGVLSGEDGRAAGESVGEGILRRTLFASGGAGSGGEERICPICGGAVGEIAGYGVRSRVCHKKASDVVVAWADGDFAGWVVDVVGREGKIDEGVA
jgi:hypothetical protein